MGRPLAMPVPRQEPEERERAALHCASCGGPVYTGEFYYQLSGDCVCCFCVADALRTARED